MRELAGLFASLVLTLALVACSGTGRGDPDRLVPVPIAPGREFHLPALSRAVATARPVRGMRCSPARGERSEAHVELFARRRVMLLPAGVGIARRGSRGCFYPAFTSDPTGVVHVAGGATVTVGELFALWGQPLGRDVMAGFRGRVHAYIDGRRSDLRPGSIPLRPRSEIVLEVGGYIPPHRTYSFPRGF